MHSRPRGQRVSGHERVPIEGPSLNPSMNLLETLGKISQNEAFLDAEKRLSLGRFVRLLILAKSNQIRLYLLFSD